jgi:hypothetical protein
MSHIKTIDFSEPSARSGEPTDLQIHYQADADGEVIALEVLVDGVTIKPRRVTAKRGTHNEPFSVTLTRGSFTKTTVMVEATIKIDKDHGSSAFDNIRLV